MKKILLVLPVLILLLCIPVRAGADFSAADSAAGETPLGTPTEIVKSILDNSLNLDGQSILKNICQILFSALKSSLPSLTGVFAAAVLLSVAKSSSFLGNASEAALMGGRAVTAIILLSGAISVIKSAKASLETVDAFSGALMPVMCTLLASSGAQSASATLAPSSAMLSTLLIKILSNFVFPLITGAMALSLADGTIGEGKLSGVTALLKSAATWVIGGLFTIFSGVITLQGLVSGVSDGISLRSIKYALSSSVPVIGGAVSESVAAVISGACALKGAAGIMGIIVIVTTVLSPTLNLLGYYAAIKCLSAVITPFCENKICDMIKNAAEYIKLAAITVFGVGVIWFIFLSALVCCGGGM